MPTLQLRFSPVNMKLKSKAISRSRSIARRFSRFCLVLFAVVLIFGVSFIPLRIAIASWQVPEPQAILVLNGNPNRIRFAAELWQSHQSLDIWVSAGSEREKRLYSGIFAAAGIPPEQIHYDPCATDTVTNFTCTVDDFILAQRRHLYLITSDYHIDRSRAIATFVLGSQGIIVTPISVPSPNFPRESRWRIVRDCFRSIVWIFTGRTGASLNPRVETEVPNSALDESQRSRLRERLCRMVPGFCQGHKR